MVSDKKRLYVALYPSGGPRDVEPRYHWAFLIGPKVEDSEEVPGTRCHVKNLVDDGVAIWIYEELQINNVRMTHALLARILIAKIEDEERLLNVLRSVSLIQNDPNWRCRTWLSGALKAIAQDGKAVGTSVLDWEKIESAARKYVADKRTAGRYNDFARMQLPRPTLDLIEGKELIT